MRVLGACLTIIIMAATSIRTMMDSLLQAATTENDSLKKTAVVPRVAKRERLGQGCATLQVKVGKKTVE